MTVGPHVFGDNRLGVWIIPSINLTDKLAHELPRFRNAAPITDVFLPEPALASHRDQVRAAGFFCHVWTATHDRDPVTFAKNSVTAFNRVKAGALELNIEEPDFELTLYVEQAVAEVRRVKPNLPLRVNIAPFKAQFMPIEMFVADPNLYIIEQAYFGNMDGRASEFDVLYDLLEHGISGDKASIMYGVLNGTPTRVHSLPSQVRPWRRGSIYSDDLLADAGLI